MSDDPRDPLGQVAVGRAYRRMAVLIPEIIDAFGEANLPERYEKLVYDLCDVCAKVGFGYVEMRDYVRSIDDLLVATDEIREATENDDSAKILDLCKRDLPGAVALVVKPFQRALDV